MDKDFKLTRLVSNIFRVLGGVAGALGVVFCIVFLVTGGTADVPRWTGALQALFFGFFLMLQFYLIGDVVRLLLRIEENTRR